MCPASSHVSQQAVAGQLPGTTPIMEPPHFQPYLHVQGLGVKGHRPGPVPGSGYRWNRDGEWERDRAQCAAGRNRDEVLSGLGPGDGNQLQNWLVGVAMK